MTPLEHSPSIQTATASVVTKQTQNTTTPHRARTSRPRARASCRHRSASTPTLPRGAPRARGADSEMRPMKARRAGGWPLGLQWWARHGAVGLRVTEAAASTDATRDVPDGAAGKHPLVGFAVHHQEVTLQKNQRRPRPRRGRLARPLVSRARPRPGDRPARVSGSAAATRPRRQRRRAARPWASRSRVARLPDLHRGSRHALPTSALAEDRASTCRRRQWHRD